MSQPLVDLAPSPATRAAPIGVAVVLIGFFVEAGVALDVLLVVVVLQVLAGRMRDLFGGTDLAELRELRD